MEKILVTRSSMPDFDEYIEEIRDLWNTHWLTNMGAKHIEFQKQLKSYLDVCDVELLTNGHMALELSIQALGLNQLDNICKGYKKIKKNEVITTPFTFASTTHAIVRNGLEPVFCDIDPVTFTIDVDQIEKLITDRTVAILPVHVYGNVCNVEELKKIADKYELKILYDAAHAFGVKYKGTGIGNFGDASCFSFHATKVFNTIEGGAVSFNNDEFGKELYRLKNFGIRNETTVDGVGANAKMNEFCAAMGICNLRHIDNEIEKRKVLSEKYDYYFAGIKGIQIRVPQTDVVSNYSYYPIVIDEKLFGHSRDEVSDILERNGIYSRKYFYPLTNSFDCFHGKYDVNKTPIADRISRNVLTLPLYADLDVSEVDRISSIISGMVL